MACSMQRMLIYEHIVAHLGLQDVTWCPSGLCMSCGEEGCSHGHAKQMKTLTCIANQGATLPLLFCDQFYMQHPAPAGFHSQIC